MYSVHRTVRTPEVWWTESSGLTVLLKLLGNHVASIPSDSSPTMTPYTHDPSDAILPISHCRLTPQGVISVMHHLGQHSLFTDMPEERLRAMAFAFLAHGGSSDDDHIIDADSFHYMHYEANKDSRRGSWRNNMCESYLTLVMDMVSSLLIAAALSLI